MTLIQEIAADILKEAPVQVVDDYTIKVIGSHPSGHILSSYPVYMSNHTIDKGGSTESSRTWYTLKPLTTDQIERDNLKNKIDIDWLCGRITKNLLVYNANHNRNYVGEKFAKLNGIYPLYKDDEPLWQYTNTRNDTGQPIDSCYPVLISTRFLKQGVKYRDVRKMVEFNTSHLDEKTRNEVIRDLKFHYDNDRFSDFHYPYPADLDQAANRNTSPVSMHYKLAGFDVDYLIASHRAIEMTDEIIDQYHAYQPK